MNLAASTEALVRELLSNTGRLAHQKEISFDPMQGNSERRDYNTRRRFLVRSQGGIVAVLITGTDLAPLRHKSELFSSAYPNLACPVFAHGSAGSEDVLLTEYFDGLTAADALNDAKTGTDGVLAALHLVEKQFTQKLKTSTPGDTVTEIQDLLSRVSQITYWTPADRGVLESTVFPFATTLLAATPPLRRVTNGDFVLSNILLNAQGEVRVIDYEQASITHFFAEDWLRLTYWKTPGDLRAYALSRAGDLNCTQLYLWLKQLVFEAEVMQPAKAAADLRHWGREILRMAEQQYPDFQRSLLWPSEKKSDLSKVLQLNGSAHYNYHRAIDLCEYTEHIALVQRKEKLVLQDEVFRQRNLVRQREVKIHQMQTSFSWRATAWLRALRRKCIDPYFKKSSQRPPSLPSEPLSPELRFPFASSDFFRPDGGQLHYQIDTPASWTATNGDVTLEGWVFTELPIKLCRVRARIGDRIYVGTYGLDRADIAEKFLPQAYSGFRVATKVENTDTEIVLEVGDKQEEWTPFFSKSLLAHEHPPVQTSCRNYASWVDCYDTSTAEQLELLRRKAAVVSGQPLISVVMPVFNTPAQFLIKAIESVREQVYPRWELCIADDASTESYVRPLIEKYAKEDSRIKPVFRPTNGHISAASNSALEIATGKHTTFLDHDDELAPHALYCVALAIAEHPAAEIIYSDEDKIDESGHRFTPHFKPDWNPDLLTSQNYFCHLTTYRTATLRELGGLRAGYEGSQDWDLALRVSERAQPEQILHIPRVLYHWRAIKGSTATELSAKQYTSQAARKALVDHFTRLGQSVKLSLVIGNHWRVQYPLPNTLPLVTLIIPTRDRRELLIKCIESIQDNTSYSNFEILVADNESDDPKLLAYYEKMQKRGRFSVLSCPGPFNFSAINNRAVKYASGDIIGLLNNDLEAMHSGWLDEMVSQALRSEIGVVGAKLYYPDMTVQHAGVITGLGGVAGHAFKHFPRSDPGTPQFRPHLVHDVTAVTAACVVLRKSVFLEAGGFDEENLKIAFNDVDFCLRVQSLGYRNLFTPFAEFIHHESASRGAEDSPDKIARFQAEIAFMKQRWGEQLLNDPAYNSNLSLDTEDFAYAFPPRISN